MREAAEIEKDGFIAGAVNIPVREVLKNLDKLPALDQPIVIYCGSGHRGGMVMAALQLLGYTDVKNLGGGLGAWKKAELPVEMDLAKLAAPAAGDRARASMPPACPTWTPSSPPCRKASAPSRRLT